MGKSKSDTHLTNTQFSDGEASFINLLEQQYLDELEVFADGIVKAMSTQPIASRSDEAGDHQWSREEVLVKAGMCRRAAQQALAQFSSPDSLRAFYLLKQEDAFDVDGAMKALYPDQESGKKDPLGALSIATLPEVA